MPHFFLRKPPQIGQMSVGGKFMSPLFAVVSLFVLPACLLRFPQQISVICKTGMAIIKNNNAGDDDDYDDADDDESNGKAPRRLICFLPQNKIAKHPRYLNQ